ncbi:hypothetical protein A2U01_0110528, partial [Trifolium medium]|nr:hypothetical protein [Trifolium medium]
PPARAPPKGHRSAAVGRRISAAGPPYVTGKVTGRRRITTVGPPSTATDSHPTTTS